MRVACAISGGIDSAVSALLLKRRKLDVVGVHMINWDAQDEDGLECPRTNDLADAQAVCAQLNIELNVVNFVKEYWNAVFLGFVENCRKGRTVVPDIDCNRYIKFDLLQHYAFETLRADVIATGHFVRNAKSSFMEPQGILLKGRDPLKDQSYFLSKLTAEQLKKTLFPLGNLYKSEVRRIAENCGLHRVLAKKESMGICFIGKKRRFEDFLLKYIEPVNGRYVDSESGEVIPFATHSGVHNFTLGKRVKIGEQYPNCEGLYVSGMDVDTQTIYLCRGSHHPVLYATEFLISKPYWISDDAKLWFREAESSSTGERLSLECRIQRIHPIVDCSVRRFSADAFVVEPRIPLRAACPGQMCVFYRAAECLGSAEIIRVVNTLTNRSF